MRGPTQHRVTEVDPVNAIGDCAACGPASPLTFHKSRQHWLCKVGRNARRTKRDRNTTRDYYLRRRFDLTAAQYDALLESQNGVCAICLSTCSSGRRLAVDHDHATGAIRGLLCTRCNRGIGLFEDNTDVLRQAAEYLSK